MSAAIAIQQIRNLTTDLELLSLTQKCILVEEFKKQAVVFQSTAIAQVGQFLMLAGQVIVNRKASRFEATGKVVSITPGPDKLNRFEIDLQQFNKDIWKKFLDGSKSNQARVDKMVADIRGEGE